MARIAYEKWTPNANSRQLVRHANAICEEYTAQGYDLTLRQLYYQFVARDIIPNNVRSYKNLGNIIDQARKSGFLDWKYIVDRTRNLKSNSHWDDPGSIMQGAARSFMLDRWEGQPTRVEVWVEKEALASVIERASAAYDCAWFCCRGYTSTSEIWSAAQRLGKYIAAGQDVVVLHLGDHDPSGVDMSRDIEDRLRRIIYTDYLRAHPDEFKGDSASYQVIGDVIEDSFDHPSHGSGGLLLNRIALNMDQVEQYDPPPNPAKFTDSRAKDYIAEYGDESWELDALDPATLNDLISDKIGDYVDHSLYAEQMDAEERHTQLLELAARRWDDVVEFLESEEAS